MIDKDFLYRLRKAASGGTDTLEFLELAMMAAKEDSATNLNHQDRFLSAVLTVLLIEGLDPVDREVMVKQMVYLLDTLIGNRTSGYFKSVIAPGDPFFDYYFSWIEGYPQDSIYDDVLDVGRSKSLGEINNDFAVLDLVYLWDQFKQTE
jgi:hypothetical protein